MEEKSREVVMAISNAARYMDPFFKLSAMGTILLLQYFARMVKERKLKETEFTDFQKFLRMTEGKYDIMNVPEIPEEQLSEELNPLGIHYMILPDLEKNDGMLQVAVYQPDRENFGAWYQRHILSQMTGGEKDLQQLKNLTSGKTTIISFPLEEEEEAANTPTEIPDEAFAGKKILLVEDNELNQEIAATILEEQGFVVELANDGTVAVDNVEKADADRYDIILMDIQMPQMDGYEATRRIRALKDKRKANIPIYAMTANAFEEDRQKALESGLDGHIAKPIDIPNLMAVLKEALQKQTFSEGELKNER